MFKYIIVGSHPAAASIAYHLARLTPRVCLVGCGTDMPKGLRPVIHRGNDGKDIPTVKRTMSDLEALGQRYQIPFERKGSLRLGRRLPTDMRRMQQHNVARILRRTAPALMEHFMIPEEHIIRLDTRDGLLDAEALTRAYTQGFEEYGGVVADQPAASIESVAEGDFRVRAGGDIIRGRRLVKVGATPYGEPLKLHRWKYRLTCPVPSNCPSIALRSGTLSAMGDHMVIEALENAEGGLLASCRALQALVPEFASVELVEHTVHAVGDTCTVESMVQHAGRMATVRGAAAHSPGSAGGVGREVAAQLSARP